MKYTYIPELDGVRAFSILLVLATHLLPLGPKYLELNSMTGPMGMSLFFCLSGFLITRFLHDSPAIGVFFSRRVARIYPLLAVYAFFVAGILYWRWDAFMATVLFYINYTDTVTFKGISHLWSICVEFHFYIGIGLIVWMTGRRGFWVIPPLAVIVMVLRIDAGAYVDIRTHLRIDEILSGSMLAIIWLNPEDRRLSLFRRLTTREFFIILPLWMLSSHQAGGFICYFRPYLTMLLVGSVLFMGEGPIRRLLRHRSLAYIAKISYALYVWHPLMALGWLGEGGRWTLYLLKRPLTFALTFLFAHISTHTLERYFMHLARRSGTGKAARDGLS